MVVSDGDRTFQWILARLLGANLVWMAYALWLWAADSGRWNDYMTGGVAGAVALRLVDMTPFRYLPPVLLVIWLKNGLLPCAYGLGVRELSRKHRGTPITLGFAMGAGMAVHFLAVAPLLDATIKLLTGSYP